MPKQLIEISLCSMLLAAATVGPAAAQQSVTPASNATENLAAKERCIEAPVDVSAWSEDDRRLACSAAGDALRRLARCKIPLRRPLHIQIRKEVPHPLGRTVLGFFDVSSERLYVKAYETISTLVRATPYGVVPQGDLFKSAVVHEVVHAVMHQNAEQYAQSASGQEYPAYALQIASLPPDARESFLKSVGNRLGTEGFVFNDILLSMDPFLFAAHAYEHFKASPDGCAHLLALLEGEPDFISTPLY